MPRLLRLPALLACLLLAACGSYRDLPSHGGGKRLALEQVAVSAAIRAAIGQMPFEVLRGKTVNLDLAIIQDEGSGFMNGGRPSLMGGISATAGSAVRNMTGLVNGTGSVGAVPMAPNYQMNTYLSVSDRPFLVAILASALGRNNVTVRPDASGSDGPPATHTLEVIVDVLGIVRERQDWLVTNRERTRTIVSMEFVISPHAPGQARTIRRVSYEASYAENYILWSGPVEEGFTLRRLPVLAPLEEAEMPQEAPTAAPAHAAAPAPASTARLPGVPRPQ
jgi:hypothetical protein